MDSQSSSTENKLVSENRIWGYLSIFAWLTTWLFFLIPFFLQFGVWYHFKRRDQLVAAHAAQAFNFAIGSLVFILLGTIGFALLFMLLFFLVAGAALLFEFQLPQFLSRGLSYTFLGFAGFGFSCFIIFVLAIWQSIKNFMRLSDGKNPEYLFSVKILKVDSTSLLKQ